MLKVQAHIKMHIFVLSSSGIRCVSDNLKSAICEKDGPDIRYLLHNQDVALMFRGHDFDRPKHCLSLRNKFKV